MDVTETIDWEFANNSDCSMDRVWDAVSESCSIVFTVREGMASAGGPDCARAPHTHNTAASAAARRGGAMMETRLSVL
eukprot:g3933.t1